MESAERLYKVIKAIKRKLASENIDIADYDKAIECLSKCVAPNFCIEIYEKYINY